MVLSDVRWFRDSTNGNIIPLDGLIKQLEIKVDDFQSRWSRIISTPGKQWALPMAGSTPPFHHNKDHFKARGDCWTARPRCGLQVRRVGAEAQGQLRAQYA